MPGSSRLVVFCLLCGCVLTVRGQEPSAEETLVLELVNRFRADPGDEGLRLRRMRPPRPPHAGLDWTLFLEELEALPPAQPLVFAPSLLRAARNHAAYMHGHGEYGHTENEKLKGFTGRGPLERAAGAGFSGLVLECAVGGLPGVDAALWTCIVDDGPGGLGGMQPGRKHRAALARRGARFFGCGASQGEGGGRGRSFVFLVGEGEVTRAAGGVFFCDLDRDGFYDPGEGVGGVTVQAGRKRGAVAWSSGAWALLLEDTKAIPLTGRFRGLRFATRVPAGDRNVKWDLDLLPGLEKRIRALLGRIGAAKGRGAARMQAALFATCEDVPLPGELRGKVDAAAAGAAADLLAARKRVLEALDLEEPRPFARTLGQARKPYRGTVADAWFGEASRIVKLRKAVDTLESRASRGIVPKKQLDRALSTAHALEGGVSARDLRAVVAALTARLDELARGSRLP